MDKESKLAALKGGSKDLAISKDEFEKSNKHTINPIMPEGYERTFHFLECESILFEYEGQEIWKLQNETITITVPAGVGFRVMNGKCRSS